MNETEKEKNEELEFMGIIHTNLTRHKDEVEYYESCTELYEEANNFRNSGDAVLVKKGEDAIKEMLEEYSSEGFVDEFDYSFTRERMREGVDKDSRYLVNNNID